MMAHIYEAGEAELVNSGLVHNRNARLLAKSIENRISKGNACLSVVLLRDFEHKYLAI